nr:MAG TPA: ATP dependent DNA helicase [Caudoviricetes sp.]
MSDTIYKFKVKFIRRFYPTKLKDVEGGSWQINRVQIVEKATEDGFEFGRGEVSLIGNQVLMRDDNSTYIVHGKKVFNDKYNEWQYEVVYSQEYRPLKTNGDKRDFLSLFLTERQIDEMYKALDDPFEAFDKEDIESLCQVKGVGVKTAEKMIKRYIECKDCGSAHAELIKLGLTPNMAHKLTQHYKSSDVALEKIMKNPYILAEEVKGIGFSKADEIAQLLGIGEHDPRTIRAFILYHLESIGEQGHTYTTLNLLEDAIIEQLNLEDMNLLDKELDKLVDDGKVIYIQGSEDDTFALKEYYETERNIAYHIKRLANAPSNINLTEEELNERLTPLEKKQGWQFGDRQRDGMLAIANHNVVVITGRAGCGKTSAVAGVLACLDSWYTFEQTALSGKASVNLTEATGQEGKTIHRLLKYQPRKGFAHNKNNPLKTHMVILDEAGMLDCLLANNLFEAIPTGSKLVILGDIAQLEAIGAGNLLSDLIDSGVVPVVEFDKVHRQGAKSGIIPFSFDVADGKCRYKDSWVGEEILGELQDLKVIGFSCEKGATKPSIDLIIREFKEMYQECKDISQVGVVLPTKSNGTSCYKVNQLIQDIVLPKRRRGDGIELGVGKETYTIYKGDKVINRKNNYKVEPNIFNGNMGEVVSVNAEEEIIVVDFYNIGEVAIEGDQLKAIELGYAITTHSAQGSGIPYLIYCVDYSHFTVLNREQAYTGITRAKKKCSFIFETKALNRAIRTSNIKHKRTFLYHMLLDEL